MPQKLFTSSYIPTLSFASDDDDYVEPKMVTDCNDDDGDDEDVGEGWDEECFSLFIRRIADKCTYCNPFQIKR